MTTGMFDDREYLVSMDFPALADHLSRMTGQPKTLSFSVCQISFLAKTLS